MHHMRFTMTIMTITTSILLAGCGNESASNDSASDDSAGSEPAQITIGVSDYEG